MSEETPQLDDETRTKQLIAHLSVHVLRMQNDILRLSLALKQTIFVIAAGWTDEDYIDKFNDLY